MIRCAEYMLYSNVLYGLSMPLVKASVVFMLLHFTTEKKYRWTLYIMQIVATLMAVIGILASLLYCRPVQAYWNPLLGKCGDFMVVVRIGYAWTAIGIVTDWCTAILPWFVVRKLQLSRRSKTSIMVILGLGAVASTATIVRAPYLQYYLVQKDRLCELSNIPSTKILATDACRLERAHYSLVFVREWHWHHCILTSRIALAFYQLSRNYSLRLGEQIYRRWHKVGIKAVEYHWWQQSQAYTARYTRFDRCRKSVEAPRG